MTKWFGKYWDKTINGARGSVLLDAQNINHPFADWTWKNGTRQGVI